MRWNRTKIVIGVVALLSMAILVSLLVLRTGDADDNKAGNTPSAVNSPVSRPAADADDAGHTGFARKVPSSAGQPSATAAAIATPRNSGQPAPEQQGPSDPEEKAALQTQAMDVWRGMEGTALDNPKSLRRAALSLNDLPDQVAVTVITQGLAAGTENPERRDLTLWLAHETNRPAYSGLWKDVLLRHNRRYADESELLARASLGERNAWIHAITSEQLRAVDGLGGLAGRGDAPEVDGFLWQLVASSQKLPGRSSLLRAEVARYLARSDSSALLKMSAALPAGDELRDMLRTVLAAGKGQP